jgi:rare lipoprotein A
VVLLSSLLLANCSSSKLFGKIDPKYGVAASPRVIEPGQPVPKGGGTYRVGKPYLIAGRMYVPEENTRYRAIGLASWYGDDFHGRLTANGEVYDMESISAAHPTLPMPSYVRVTNLANRRSLIVRVNDRGPYHADREIDLSFRAAQILGFHGRGLTRVSVEYVGPASLEGSDDRRLMATLREGQPAPAPSQVRLASTQGMVPRLPRTAPTPPERPFDLGEDATALREAGFTDRTHVASSRFDDAGPSQPRQWALRPSFATSAPAMPDRRQTLTSPVSAFAPGYVGAPAVASGRGLY